MNFVLKICFFLKEFGWERSIGFCSRKWVFYGRIFDVFGGVLFSLFDIKRSESSSPRLRIAAELGNFPRSVARSLPGTATTPKNQEFTDSQSEKSEIFASSVALRIP